MFPPLALFFSAGSLALTHTNAPLVHLVSLSLMSGALELSALTNDSPLYSHLPPLITHRRFVTGSLAGSLCLSLSTNLSKKNKKKKILPGVFVPSAGKAAIYSRMPWQTIEAEHYAAVNAIQSLKIAFCKAREESPKAPQSKTSKEGWWRVAFLVGLEGHFTHSEKHRVQCGRRRRTELKTGRWKREALARQRKKEIHHNSEQRGWEL